MSKKLPRDEIIKRVCAGRMTPEEAEEWAVSNGEAPFAEKRTLQHYNPIEDPDWSLPMVAAWIIWRTPEEVMNVVPRKGKQCKIWHSEKFGLSALPRPILPSIEEQSRISQTPPQAFYILEVPEDLPLTEVLFNAVRRDPDHKQNLWQVSPVEANELLYAKLREGKLKATGIKDKNNRTIISPEEWQDFPPFNIDKDPCSVFGPGSEHPRYIKVSVRRDDVLEKWPVRKVLDEENIILNKPLPIGSPSKRPLYWNEFEKRCASGKLLPRVSYEADYLEKWAKENHPGAKISKITIESAIRAAYKKASKLPSKL